MALQQYRIFTQSKWMGLSGNAILALVNKTGSAKKISILGIEVINNTKFGFTQTADTNLPSPTRIKICNVTSLDGGEAVSLSKLDSAAASFPSTINVKTGAGYTPTLVQTHPNTSTYTDTTVSIGDTTFTPSSAPSPAWITNEHRDAQRYLVIASGGNAGTYRIDSNTSTALTLDRGLPSSGSTSGYVAQISEITHHGVVKTLLPSAANIPSNNFGTLHTKNGASGLIFSKGRHANLDGIIIRAAEKIAILADQQSANIPMMVEATFVVDGTPNRTYQTTFYTYLTSSELSILSIDNNSGSGEVIRLVDLSISEVGTQDTPYFQLVPVGSIDPSSLSDPDKKIIPSPTDSADGALSTSICEVFTNVPMLPYGVPTSYLAEGSSGSPKGFNYLNTKDFIGPVYATFFPEAAAFKYQLAALWSTQVPGTLNSQISQRHSFIKGLFAPIVVREGEGIAIVSGAETATITTAIGISGWAGYDFAMTIAVENATTPSLTLTGLIDNTEVRIYSANTTTLLGGVENSSGGTFSYSYDFSPATYVDIMIVSLGYEIIRLEDIELTAEGTSIPIQQRIDRNYST